VYHHRPASVRDLAKQSNDAPFVFGVDSTGSMEGDIWEPRLDLQIVENIHQWLELADTERGELQHGEGQVRQHC
jgi:hypothetical protein